MKAALLTAYEQPLVVEDVTPVPPAADDVVVRTGASAFCYTDALNQRGVRGIERRLPVLLGHSAVGVVEHVGSRVQGVAPGDRVLVPGTPECGECRWCRSGRVDQCADLLRPPAHVADRSDGTPVTGSLGTYAEQIRVRGSFVFKLPGSVLSDEQLSLLGCGITTGLGAVFNVARVTPGSSVAVVGCGHLGLWMVQAARVAGAERIIAVDPVAERRRLAEQLGATDVVHPDLADPVEQVVELAGGIGVDYALEAAGSPRGQEQAFLMARRAGVVVWTGVESQRSTITLSQTEASLRGRDLLSCQSGRVRLRDELPRFIELIESGQLQIAPIITSRYALDDIQQAVEASWARRDLTGVIVPDPRREA